MSYQAEYEKWLTSKALSSEEKEELLKIAQDEKEKEGRFYGPLEFGTAGLRGIMGVGLHNMNIHVIRHASQAFAEVILEEGEEAAKRGIAIDFDCRLNSALFAKTAACVMAANGIQVYLFEGLRPTPELSFAVREYHCMAGINVTASHNPKEYNGYKVYWSDGAQLPPRHAAKVAQKMADIDIFDGVKVMPYEEAIAKGLIRLLGKETDERFLEEVLAMANEKENVLKVADKFKMVYTPFHGCGHYLIPETLKRAGFRHILCEPRQMVIDGSFPTVDSPNPENPEGFYLAIDLAKKEGADFILGSDPDADRVGIMVKNPEGEFIALTGNQTGALFLDYYIGALTRNGKLPKEAVALKTIVSTDLVKTIAEKNGVACFNTFTGFKFMAEKKNELEATTSKKVIWSYEESYGYMVGDYVRDKDAVTAALLLSEMAAYYASQGMTVYDALQALYQKYGHTAEYTLNLVMPGLDGLQKMQGLMQNLRENPLTDIKGVAINVRKDYKDGSVIDLLSGEKSEMELKDSNVLEYQLVDGSKILVRPSGTEPKVKVYLLVKADTQQQCQERIALFTEWAKSLAQ